MEEEKIHQEAKEETRPLTDREAEEASGGMVITPPWVKGIGGRVEEDPQYKE